MQMINHVYAKDNTFQQQTDNNALSLDLNKMQSNIAVSTDETISYSNSIWAIVHNLVPWMLVFLVFYFLVFRSQEKKRKEREQRITSMLKKGEQIITTSGIYGTVVSVDDKTLTLIIEIAPNTKIRIMRTAVADVISKKQQNR